MTTSCFKCRTKRDVIHKWRVCADGPWRRICVSCDAELNKMALRWLYPKTWKEKLKAYETAR